MRRRTSSRVRTPVDGARLRTPVKMLHELDFLLAPCTLFVKAHDSDKRLKSVIVLE